MRLEMAWELRQNQQDCNVEEIETCGATFASIASASVSWTVDFVTARANCIIYPPRKCTARLPKTVPCVTLERKCAKRVAEVDASRIGRRTVPAINTVRINKK